MDWIENEMRGTRLPDKRLNARLRQLLTQLSHAPNESVPANCQTWPETLAAYRFFDNERITPAQILSGHLQASLQRITEQPVVLLVQDSTELSYVREGEPAFAKGTLHYTEKESYWLHPTVAFTPQRVNLGVLHHEFWQRTEVRPKGTHKRCSIEAKESMRWLRGYELACAVQRRCPASCVISVADREGDIYDWFLNAQQQPLSGKADYIIRAKSNRRLDADDDDEASYLWSTLTAADVLGRYVIDLARTPTRAARQADVEVRAQAVSLRRPKHRSDTLPAIDLYAVYAREINPPAEEKAVDWMLLTSLAVEDLANAQTVIGWYKARWEIELFFRTLKSGCQVEALRLETDNRLENAIAIYQILAWHLHNTTMLAREAPEQSCEQVFGREEWRMIYALQRKPISEKAPPLRDCVRTLAQVGGFLARKGDGEPGMKTVWRGYIRLLNALDAVAALNADRERKICV